jgi:Winged helix DNA-binding domain
LAPLRARSQLIHRPPGHGHPADVLRAIGGAQAQEPRAGRLQVRARSRGLTAAGVETARTEERSIMRHWVMRMTAHLFPTEDFGWLAPLFADRIISVSLQRLAAIGVSDSQRDRGLAAVRRALESRGELTRGEALRIAAEAGYPANVQTRTQLATLLVVGGDACIGPDAGRESVFVATREWVGEPKRRDREDSLAELARRYIAAFAPATERDFASWSGLPLGECRVGLERIAGELREVAIPGATAFAPRPWQARAPRSRTVRLLPAFDTYLMGYGSRVHATDQAGEKRILPGGGVLRPTICVDGRLVGLWSSKRSGKRLTVSLEPFEPLGDEVMEALAADVADIGRFEGAEAALA